MGKRAGFVERFQEELKRRFDAYTDEIAQTLGHRESRNADEVPLDMRGYQLGLNFALSILECEGPMTAGGINLFRTSVDALGVGRDVRVEEARTEVERVGYGGWSDAELETVRNGYRREMETFERHFPRESFPYLYDQPSQ